MPFRRQRREVLAARTIGSPHHESNAAVVTVVRATLFDLDRGTVIGAVSGVQPGSALAFDERTGHLFVLTQPLTGAYAPVGHGGVTMLDARNGKTPRGGSVLTGGSVSVLDTGAGAVRATIPRGGGPHRARR